jgi:hypothetical protein
MERILRPTLNSHQRQLQICFLEKIETKFVIGQKDISLIGNERTFQDNSSGLYDPYLKALVIGFFTIHCVLEGFEVQS